MVKYREIVPRALEDNSVLRGFIAYILGCAARRKRVATSPDFQAADAKLAAPWLAAKIREAPDSQTALNCLEAATAVEVCIDNLDAYLPVAVFAIRQTYRLSLRESMSPLAPQSFITLMCERAFWGPVSGLARPDYYKRRLLYPGDWHMSRKEDMQDLLRSFLALEQIEDVAWHEAIVEVFGRQKTATKVARLNPVGGQTGSVNTAGPFRLRHVWLARIGSQEELEFAAHGLANLESSNLRGVNGGELFARGLVMFGDAVTYLATERMILNAQAIRNTLFGEADRQREPVEITKLLAHAERLVGSAPPEWSGLRPVLQVPWGMEVVGDFIAFRGDNTLSSQERDNVALYFRLAGDLCAVGEYLRDKKYAQLTVGEYLADHPRVDPEEFADKINPQRQRDSSVGDPASQGLALRFGSNYFLGRNRKGWGFNT